MSFWNDRRYVRERRTVIFLFFFTIAAIAGIGFFMYFSERDRRADLEEKLAATPTPTPEAAATPVEKDPWKEGVAAFERGDMDAARDAFEACLKKGENVADAANMMGVIAGLKNQFGVATQYFSQAILYEGDRSDFYFNRSETYRQLGKYPEAIDDLQRSLELEPGNLLAESKLLIAKLQNGQVKEVKSAIKTQRELDSANLAGTWLFAGAALAFWEGKNAEADVLISDARVVLPGDVFTAMIRDPFFQPYSEMKAVARHAVKPEATAVATPSPEAALALPSETPPDSEEVPSFRGALPDGKPPAR